VTQRRTAKTVLNFDQLGRLLGLHDTQRVVHAYVTDEPANLFVVFEGGTELPDLDIPWVVFPDTGWRDHGWESPIVAADQIPHPE
jgi:hypothetical protein